MSPRKRQLDRYSTRDLITSAVSTLIGADAALQARDHPRVTQHLGAARALIDHALTAALERAAEPNAERQEVSEP